MTGRSPTPVPSPSAGLDRPGDRQEPALNPEHRSPPSGAGSGLRRVLGDLLGRRSVRYLTAGWILGFLIVAVLGVEGMPDVVVTGGTVGTLGFQGVLLGTELAFLAIIAWLTRKRTPIDVDQRLNGTSRSLVEVAGLWAYAAVGIAVAASLGYGLHAEGAVYGPIEDVARADLIGWAMFNITVFALVPYAGFRALGYSNRDLGLRSTNLRGDAVLIAIVLAIEAAQELSVFTGIFDLSLRQVMLGMPLAFVIFLAGTGLPIMIPIFSILVPRYRQLTGSTTAATILGGLSYAAFHVTEYWTAFDTFPLGVVSIVLVFSQFTGPGMIKSLLTLRTGNAWVHVWAYHSIVPHVTIDTPTVVDAFEIG